MPYPRLINLSETVKQNLLNFLSMEIWKVRAEKQRYLDLLKEDQKIYWAEPKEGKIKFPFSGASKLVIPLGAISVETIHSKDMSTMFGLPELVSCKAKTPEFTDIEYPYGRWFDNEIKVNGGIKSFVKNTDLERVKYGNCVGRADYVYEERYAIQEDEEGKEQELTVVTKNGVCAHYVPLSRFVMPFNDQDPQSCQMVGEELSRTLYEIETLEQSKYFYPGTVEKLKGFLMNPVVSSNQTGEGFKRNQQDLEKKNPIPFPTNLIWYRLELDFNITDDPNGKKHAIILDYHYESAEVMAVRYNWRSDLRRPYRIGCYFPIESRWTGIGAIKMAKEFQKEVTTQHRQRIDNGTIANTQMFKINKLSGYGPNEPIFPGKMWFLDDMDHLESLPMADIKVSSFNNEQATLIYHQQRLGMDDLALGMQSSGTPGTATDIISRVQESKGKNGYYFNNLKDFVNEIIIDMACEQHQFGPKDIDIVDRLPGGQLIRQVLSLPEGDIRSGLLFTLKTVDVSDNKVTDRQNWMQYAQMLQQYWAGQLQLAQMTGQQNLVLAVVIRAMTASTEAMKQISQTFDMTDVDRLLMMEELTNGFNSLLKQGGGGGPQNPIQNAGNNQSSPTIPPNIIPSTAGV